MGFYVEFSLQVSEHWQVQAEFWDKLITFIEANRLQIGGNLDSFYITRFGRGSTNDSDRELVKTWLEQQSGVQDIVIWPLDDSRRGPFLWYQPATDSSTRSPMWDVCYRRSDIIRHA